MTKPSEETTNALIQKDISYMRSDITEIKQTLKDQAALAATKVELFELTKIVNEQSTKINNLQKFQYTLAGAITILPFLAPYILKGLNLQ